MAPVLYGAQSASLRLQHFASLREKSKHISFEMPANSQNLQYAFRAGYGRKKNTGLP